MASQKESEANYKHCPSDARVRTDQCLVQIMCSLTVTQTPFSESKILPRLAAISSIERDVRSDCSRGDSAAAKATGGGSARDARAGGSWAAIMVWGVSGADTSAPYMVRIDVSKPGPPPRAPKAGPPGTSYGRSKGFAGPRSDHF